MSLSVQASTQNPVFSPPSAGVMSPGLIAPVLALTGTSSSVLPLNSGNIITVNIAASPVVVYMPAVATASGCSFDILIARTTQSSNLRVSCPTGTLYGSVASSGAGSAMYDAQAQSQINFLDSAGTGSSIKLISDGSNYYIASSNNGSSTTGTFAAFTN